MSTTSFTRRAIRFTLPRLFSLRGMGTVAALVLVVVGGWLWFSNSAFVRVRQITISGLSGPAVPQIKRSLRQAALTMSTLHVNVAKLDQAVSHYPEVRTLTVSTHLPHSVAIHVYEQVPVASISVAGQTEVVDGAGDVLQRSMRHGVLPTVPLKAAPAQGTIESPGARAVLRVLAAAPYSFLTHVQTATDSKANGVILTLRNGPQLYFGTDGELERKWKSALATIISSDSHGASYIDVSDPERPAAGAGAVTLPSSSNVSTAGTP
jgi:cell division septal protein FtsQ